MNELGESGGEEGGKPGEGRGELEEVAVEVLLLVLFFFNSLRVNKLEELERVGSCGEVGSDAALVLGEAEGCLSLDPYELSGLLLPCGSYGGRGCEGKLVD